MPLNYIYSHARAFAIASSLKRAGLDGPGMNLPVIYMPGILGTKLYDREMRLNVWGDPSGLLRHKQEHAPFRLSSCPCKEAPPNTGVAGAGPRVIATETLHAFPIVPGLVHTLVTAELVHVLERALGYRLERDLFFIGHDWRKDYREIAGQLPRALKRIDDIYGKGQKVVLMGQSSANYALCHWLANESEQTKSRIARWYAFGPPWLGTFHALSMLHEGYFPGTRKFHGFTPSDVATYPSAYQLLRRNAEIMDSAGNLVQNFDLTDPACWKEYGLGPWHPAQEKRHLSDSEKLNELTPCLEMGKLFATELAANLEKVRNIPQLWFLGDANRAVRYAVAQGKHLNIKAGEVRQNAPHLADKALYPGDDHLPLEDFALNPNGPFVRSADNLPYGESFMFVGGAKDHRALINYTPNLKVLARDLAIVRREYQ